MNIMFGSYQGSLNDDDLRQGTKGVSQARIIINDTANKIHSEVKSPKTSGPARVTTICYEGYPAQ